MVLRWDIQEQELIHSGIGNELSFSSILIFKGHDRSISCENLILPFFNATF